MNIKTSTKEEKQEANKKTYSHIASKLWKNRSEFAFLTVCRYVSIISFLFLKCFTYFPLRGLFKINFKLLCISAYTILKFPLSSMASFVFFSSSVWNLDQKQKGPGTSDQLLFKLQNKFRKLPLLLIYDHIWWCNIEWFLSYFKNFICKFMQLNLWHHNLFHFHLSFCV